MFSLDALWAKKCLLLRVIEAVHVSHNYNDACFVWNPMLKKIPPELLFRYSAEISNFLI